MRWKLIALEIPGASSMELDSLIAREGLSTPFEIELELTGPSLSHDDARCAMALALLQEAGGGERYFTGVVETAVTRLGTTHIGETLHHRVVLRPLPYVALSRRSGYRIFQNKTVVEIVQEVLENAAVPASAVDWGGLDGTYPSREYCVQYGEDDWSFVSRLLEEEGIFYVFEHAYDGALMRFCDHNTALTEGTPLRWVVEDHASADEPLLFRWSDASRVREARVTLRDFDMLRPSLDLTAEASGDDAFDREHYEFPGRYQDPAEGARLAAIRLEALRAMRDTYAFTGNAPDAVYAGARFEVLEHPTFEGQVLVTASETRVRGNRVGEPVTVEVFADAMLRDRRYRPPRRAPRPRPVGLQTARVVGPAGAEVHCDEHGRIKVQFPWHREGEMDDRSSCWLRVTQPHTTGSIFIPRVGWEVLVEFRDGDPDRPLCLGKVWNPFEPAPRALPAQKTVTCHASSSIPGRTGTNELVLDDTAGSERVSIKGQHDINTVVANNRTFSVGAVSERNVNGTRTVSIGGNEDASVAADLSSSVGTSQTVSVGGTREVNADGTATEEIVADYSHTVGGVEHIQVGSPGAALLEVIASAAIGAATSKVASAANRAQAAMLGPIAPALGQAREAAGAAGQLAGPATALIAGGNPNIAALSQAAGALSSAPGALDAGEIAAGIAKSAASGALAAAGMSAAGGGSGTWAATIGGAVTENIGGANIINSASGVNFGIGGANTETIGAARLELVKGGKSETTGGAKAETVGVYMVKASADVAIDAAAAIALNVAGASKQTIGGSASISADGPLVITAPSLTLAASGTITLKCGGSEVVISGGGVSLEGLADVEIEGGKVDLTEAPLGT